MKRNTGQPIRQMDPFAIQVSQPNISIPQLPPTVYRANTTDLENISRSLNLFGQSVASYGRMKRREKAAEEADERRAAAAAEKTRTAFEKSEAGAGAEAGQFDAAVLVSSFNDDTLDTSVGQEADPQSGSPRMTEEDLLLEAIDKAGDPARGLVGWIQERLQGPLSQLETDYARKAYYDETFLPTFKAGLSWINRREEQRQGVLLDEIAVDIARQPTEIPSVEDLVGITENDVAVEPINKTQAAELLISASETASAAGRFDRARSILGKIPEAMRDAKWYESRDVTENAFFDSSRRVLGQELRSDIFAPSGTFQNMFGPGTTPSDESLDSLDQALLGLMFDPDFDDAGRLARLRAAQAQVDPLGNAFVTIGKRAAAIQIEVEDEEKINDLRKENQYQASLTGLALLTESVIEVKIDGATVRIDREAPEANEQMLRYFVSKYGDDGRLYFDDYLKLRESKRYNASEPGPDQDRSASTMLEELRSISSPADRTEFLRNEVYDAAYSGMITFAQHRALISDANILGEISPEYEAQPFRDGKRTLIEQFAAGMGVEADFDMTGNMAGLLASKANDPEYVQALNEIVQGYRKTYTTWLRANYQMRTENPMGFREAQERFISQRLQTLLPEVVEKGKYYSSEAFAERND